MRCGTPVSQTPRLGTSCACRCNSSAGAPAAARRDDERTLAGAHTRRRLDGAGQERSRRLGRRRSGTRAEAPALPVPGAGMSGTPFAIELRGVTKRYGAQQALSPIDLEIAEGEFFCLLGPSGCGKTTTLNLIGGFVGATTGAILIRGAPVERLPPHRRPVNTVFQSYALFPHMSVRDNVAFGLKMARVPKAEAGCRVEGAPHLPGLRQPRGRLPGHPSRRH